MPPKVNTGWYGADAKYPRGKYPREAWPWDRSDAHGDAAAYKWAKPSEWDGSSPYSAWDAAAGAYNLNTSIYELCGSSNNLQPVVEHVCQNGAESIPVGPCSELFLVRMFCIPSWIGMFSANTKTCAVKSDVTLEESSGRLQTLSFQDSCIITVHPLLNCTHLFHISSSP